MDPRGPKFIGSYAVGGDALPLFPTVAADTLEGAGPTLGGEPLIRERNDQGGTDKGSIASTTVRLTVLTALEQSM